jgi:hypothetical protein
LPVTLHDKALRGSVNPALMRPRMNRWLRSIAHRIERLLKPPASSVDKSRLMGMYLTQTNRPVHARASLQDIRQRQNGKFSQLRRRGG